MAEKPVFVVRHGSYDHRTRGLTERGRTVDAVRARDELLSRGLGGKAVVLSSTERRAVETAEVIAEGLGATVIPHERVTKGGLKPAVIDDLDELLGTVLSESGVEYGLDGSLVVVAHAPLVAVVARTDEMEIDHGHVAEYVPGTWDDLRRYIPADPWA